jgi:hypothetical protein
LCSSVISRDEWLNWPLLALPWTPDNSPLRRSCYTELRFASDKPGNRFRRKHVFLPTVTSAQLRPRTTCLSWQTIMRNIPFSLVVPNYFSTLMQQVSVEFQNCAEVCVMRRC